MLCRISYSDSNILLQSSQERFFADVVNIWNLSHWSFIFWHISFSDNVFFFGIVYFFSPNHRSVWFIIPATLSPFFNLCVSISAFQQAHWVSQIFLTCSYNQGVVEKLAISSVWMTNLANTEMFVECCERNKINGIKTPNKAYYFHLSLTRLFEQINQTFSPDYFRICLQSFFPFPK